MVGKVGDEVNTDGVSNWRGHHKIVRTPERGEVAKRALVATADRQQANSASKKSVE